MYDYSDTGKTLVERMDYLIDGVRKTDSPQRGLKLDSYLILQMKREQGELETYTGKVNCKGKEENVTRRLGGGRPPSYSAVKLGAFA